VGLVGLSRSGGVSSLPSSEVLVNGFAVVLVPDGSDGTSNNSYGSSEKLGLVIVGERLDGRNRVLEHGFSLYDGVSYKACNMCEQAKFIIRVISQNSDDM
jgi:hypothetical protein